MSEKLADVFVEERREGPAETMQVVFDGERERVNKCAPPFTEAEFDIRWGAGVDGVAELIDLGLARGLIDKSGNHMSFGGVALGNGRERSRETLNENGELQSTLRQAIVAAGPLKPGRRSNAEA